MTTARCGVGRLLITGVPGWLTEALLQSLYSCSLPGQIAIRCLVQNHFVQAHNSNGATRGDTVEYVGGDLRDPASLHAAVQDVDTVLHAAGIIHVRRTRDWYEINTRGTERLVEAAATAGVRRFVYISSNAAAGRSRDADHPLTEDDTPCPLSHYGRSKLLAEQIVHRFHQHLETVVIRPCMFYGPPVPSRHVDVYRQIATGRIPLIGDGNYARSLTYIDNLVQACRLALVHPAAAGQTYFISDEPVYTTRLITEAMAAALGVTPRYLSLPRAIGTIAHSVDMALARVGLYWQNLHLVGEADWHVGVSCEKAHRELGYAPTVEIAEGMQKAVAWCRVMGKLN